MKKLIGGFLVGWLALSSIAANAQQSVVASDSANNYTPATFTNGANGGFGFGAWDLWNKPATLGNSTAGGGGDINSTNGYAFRIVGDGNNGWANAKRNFSAPLQEGDVVSFKFTYNWDGGGRGVDIFNSTGQFANVIDVSGGNTFKVNGTTISTEWSPGAVVTVEITQEATGVQIDLTRAVNGTNNLEYTTNIVSSLPAAAFGMYNGGFSTANTNDLSNYAIFLNDLKIVGAERTSLSFTQGTWNPSEVDDYEFVLSREGSVGDLIVLSSDNTNAVTVPASVSFDAGSNSVSFLASVVSLTAGEATIVASNAASGVWAQFTVKPQSKEIFISGPDKVWEGGSRYFTLRRSSADSVGATVTLLSTDEDVLTVPASVTFDSGATVLFFEATGVGAGSATIKAKNADVDEVSLPVTVAILPGIGAEDNAGNYTSETFTNGANEGYGFGAWNIWNNPATLGDSTAGGGGDINSANGVAFRVVGDGSNGWANAKRYFAAPLEEGHVVSFTFTYNWDGGNRGVDIFDADNNQFANVIDVSGGDTFSVNGQIISKEYSPGAVVYAEFEQLADGVSVYLTRSVGGVVQLAYSTNIVHAKAAGSISLYNGGFESTPENLNNFAIYVNDFTMYGEVEPTLTFTAGTWDPSATGNYLFELTRLGAVGDEIVLTSGNTNAVTVPPSVLFGSGSNTVSFNVTVVSLTKGDATIVASKVASGAWADYTIRPQAPEEEENPPIESITFNAGAGTFGFAVPSGYNLVSVAGAPVALVNGDWNWTVLTEGVDYTVVTGNVIISVGATSGMVYRVSVVKAP